MRDSYLGETRLWLGAGRRWAAWEDRGLGLWMRGQGWEALVLTLAPSGYLHRAGSLEGGPEPDPGGPPPSAHREGGSLSPRCPGNGG